MHDVSTAHLKSLTAGVIPLHTKADVIEITPSTDTASLEFFPFPVEPLTIEAMMEYCDSPSSPLSLSSVFTERSLLTSGTPQIFGANMDQALLLKLRELNKMSKAHSQSSRGLHLRTLLQNLNQKQKIILPQWLEKTTLDFDYILYGVVLVDLYLRQQNLSEYLQSVKIGASSNCAAMVENAAGIDSIFCTKNSKQDLVFVTFGNACYGAGVTKEKSEKQRFKTDIRNQYLCKHKSKQNKSLEDDGTPEDTVPDNLLLHGITVFFSGRFPGTEKVSNIYP